MEFLGDEIMSWRDGEMERLKIEDGEMERWRDEVMKR